jgi:curved DNA-binding protein
VEFKDYYKTMGVERTATADEIRKSYRKLARKYHPDVSKEPDAERRMQEVNEANDVLSDPEKRAAYDQLAAQHQAGRDFRPPPNWDEGFEFSDGGYAGSGDYSDFFTSLFKRPGRGRHTGSFQGRGEDHHAKIMIDLVDTYKGATRSITLRSAQEDPVGQVVVKDRTLNVQIPKGIREGQHIRLAGQGNPGFGGGGAGDLYLEVYFKSDARYRIEDRDVYQTMPVAPWEAALGASVEMPTLAGPVSVKIPAGSQNGRKLRLKGRGIPANPPGDLYLVLEVVLPPANSDKARHLYETMARELAFNPRHDMGA